MFSISLVVQSGDIRYSIIYYICMYMYVISWTNSFDSMLTQAFNLKRFRYKDLKLHKWPTF